MAAQAPALASSARRPSAAGEQRQDLLGRDAQRALGQRRRTCSASRSRSSASRAGHGAGQARPRRPPACPRPRRRTRPTRTASARPAAAAPTRSAASCAAPSRPARPGRHHRRRRAQRGQVGRHVPGPGRRLALGRGQPVPRRLHQRQRRRRDPAPARAAPAPRLRAIVLICSPPHRSGRPGRAGRAAPGGALPHAHPARRPGSRGGRRRTTSSRCHSNINSVNCPAVCICVRSYNGGSDNTAGAQPPGAAAESAAARPLAYAGRRAERDAALRAGTQPGRFPSPISTLCSRCTPPPCGPTPASCPAGGRSWSGTRATRLPRARRDRGRAAGQTESTREVIGVRLRVPRRARPVVARRGPVGDHRDVRAASRPRPRGWPTRSRSPRCTSGPEYQRRGIGRRLVLTLTAGRTERTAVLSTQDADSPARRLYRSLGFADLLTGFIFPGGGPPYAVMGAELPLRGADPAAPPGPGPDSAGPELWPGPEAQQLVDLPGRPRPVQRVEVQARHALGEQPLAHPGRVLDADLAHRRPGRRRARAARSASVLGEPARRTAAPPARCPRR